MYKEALLKISKHKGLLQYTALNYADKLLIFALPLFVVFVSKGDKQAYNDIEYVFSIANILVTILNFIPQYAFYGYRQSTQRVYYTKRIKNYFWLFQLLYLLIGLLLFPFIKEMAISSISGILYLYICIRSLYLLVINFYNTYCRLIDKPAKAFLFSIPINLISFALLYVVYILEVSYTLEAFFIPQLIVIVVGLTLFVFTLNRKTFIGLKKYLQSGIKYVVPIVINTLCVAFVSNYGKIYAYNFLSEYEMYKFSYVMRMAMIIHMAHVSIIAYYSKSIYVDSKAGVNKKILMLYSLFILIASIITLFTLYIFNTFSGFDKISLDVTVFLVLLYVILHCYSAFLELYYNRRNKNIYILLFSLISCGIYLFLLFGIGVQGITSLSLYMVIYIIFYISFLFLKLKKIELHA